MADSIEYQDKMESLQKYIPFLVNMMGELKAKGNREAQLNKIQSLHEMITDKRRKLKLETLNRCEEVLSNIYCKVNPQLKLRTHASETPSSPIYIKSPTPECSRSTPASPSPPRELYSKPVTIPTEKIASSTRLGHINPRSSYLPNVDVYNSAADSFSRTKHTRVPDVYSSAAESLSKGPRRISNENLPKAPDMTKPPISLDDLKTLEDDVHEKIHAAQFANTSMSELNDMRKKIELQLRVENISNAMSPENKYVEINTTVKNSLSPKKIPDKSKDIVKDPQKVSDMLKDSVKNPQKVFDSLSPKKIPDKSKDIIKDPQKVSDMVKDSVKDPQKVCDKVKDSVKEVQKILDKLKESVKEVPSSSEKTSKPPEITPNKSMPTTLQPTPVKDGNSIFGNLLSSIDNKLIEEKKKIKKDERRTSSSSKEESKPKKESSSNSNKDKSDSKDKERSESKKTEDSISSKERSSSSKHTSTKDGDKDTQRSSKVGDQKTKDKEKEKKTSKEDKEKDKKSSREEHKHKENDKESKSRDASKERRSSSESNKRSSDSKDKEKSRKTESGNNESRKDDQAKEKSSSTKDKKSSTSRDTSLDRNNESKEKKAEKSSKGSTETKEQTSPKDTKRHSSSSCSSKSSKEADNKEMSKDSIDKSLVEKTENSKTNTDPRTYRRLADKYNPKPRKSTGDQESDVDKALSASIELNMKTAPAVSLPVQKLQEPTPPPASLVRNLMQAEKTSGLPKPVVQLPQILQNILNPKNFANNDQLSNTSLLNKIPSIISNSPQMRANSDSSSSIMSPPSSILSPSNSTATLFQASGLMSPQNSASGLLSSPLNPGPGLLPTPGVLGHISQFQINQTFNVAQNVEVQPRKPRPLLDLVPPLPFGNVDFMQNRPLLQPEIQQSRPQYFQQPEMFNAAPSYGNFNAFGVEDNSLHMQQVQQRDLFITAQNVNQHFGNRIGAPIMQPEVHQHFLPDQNMMYYQDRNTNNSWGNNSDRRWVNRDSRGLSRDPRYPRSYGEYRELKEKEAKETNSRDPRQQREVLESRDPRQQKEGSEFKDPRQQRDGLEAKDTRDPRLSRESREFKEIEARKTVETRDPRLSRDKDRESVREFARDRDPKERNRRDRSVSRFKDNQSEVAEEKSDRRSRYDSKFDKLYSSTNRDHSSSSSVEEDTFTSPLESLYTREQRRTGKGYGVQNFKIPKKVNRNRENRDTDLRKKTDEQVISSSKVSSSQEEEKIESSSKTKRKRIVVTPVDDSDDDDHVVEDMSIVDLSSDSDNEEIPSENLDNKSENTESNDTKAFSTKPTETPDKLVSSKKPIKKVDSPRKSKPETKKSIAVDIIEPEEPDIIWDSAYVDNTNSTPNADAKSWNTSVEIVIRKEKIDQTVSKQQEEVFVEQENVTDVVSSTVIDEINELETSQELNAPAKESNNDGENIVEPILEEDSNNQSLVQISTEKSSEIVPGVKEVIPKVITEQSTAQEPTVQKAEEHAEQSILAHFFEKLLKSKNKKDQKVALASLIETFSDSFSNKQMKKITQIFQRDEDDNEQESEEDNLKVAQSSTTDVVTEKENEEEKIEETEAPDLSEMSVESTPKRKGKRLRRLSSTTTEDESIREEQKSEASLSKPTSKTDLSELDTSKEVETDQKVDDKTVTETEEEPESVIVSVGERIKSRKRNVTKAKPKKKKTRSELDMLHEDLQDMFIRDGVLTATGKRMCRMLKADPNVLSSSSKPRIPTTSTTVTAGTGVKKPEEPEKKVRKKPGPKPKPKPPTKEQQIKTMKNVRVVLRQMSSESMKSDTRTLRSTTRKASLGDSEDDPKSDGDNVATEGDSSDSESSSASDNESDANEEAKTTKKPEKAAPKLQKNTAKVVKKSKIIAGKMRRPRGKKWASGIISKVGKKKKDVAKAANKTPTDSQEPTPEPEALNDMLKDFDLEPDKSYYIVGTSMSQKPLPCKLCDYVGRFLVSHYVQNHPESEVLCSRFSPDIADATIKDCLENSARYDAVTATKLTVKYKYVCRFCEFGHTVFPLSFYEHITTHTGEYRHNCGVCNYRAANGKKLISHFNAVHPDEEKKALRQPIKPTALIYGYMCGECNFVQLKRESVDEHANIFHLGEKPIIYKLNMSTFLDPGMENRPDVPETSSSVEITQETKDTPAAEDAKATEKDTVTEPTKTKSSEVPPPAAKVRQKPGPKSKKKFLTPSIIEDTPSSSADEDRPQSKPKKFKSAATAKKTAKETSALVVEASDKDKGPEPEKATTVQEQPLKQTEVPKISRSSTPKITHKKELEKLIANDDSSEDDLEKIIAVSRKGRAAKEKATAKLKSMMEAVEGPQRKKSDASSSVPAVYKETRRQSQERHAAEPMQVDEPTIPEKEKELDNRSKKPDEAAKKSDTNIFTCAESVDQEEKKIEEERLKKMEELNKSIGLRTTKLDFTDKLCDRLNNSTSDAVTVKQEPRDDDVVSKDVVPPRSPTPTMPVLERESHIPSTSTRFTTSITTCNSTTVVDKSVATSQVAARKPVLEEDDSPLPTPRLNFPQNKNNTLFSNMIEKLQGKVSEAAKNLLTRLGDESSASTSTTSTTPPPASEDTTNKDIISISGHMTVSKGENNTVLLSCKVGNCSYVNKNKVLFKQHCKLEHLNLVSDTYCDKCGEYLRSSENISLMENVCDHIFLSHNELIESAFFVKPIGKVLRMRKLSGDKLSVKKEDEDDISSDTVGNTDVSNTATVSNDRLGGISREEQEAAVASIAQIELSPDNPFSFKITDVVSLAESETAPVAPVTPLPQQNQSRYMKVTETTPPPLKSLSEVQPPPLTRIQKNPSATQLVVKEAKLTQAELNRPRKTLKAMTKFIENVSDLYKCPHHYCMFSTNFREYLERHLKAHQSETEVMIPCVYCDMKTPWEHVPTHIDIRHAHCRFVCSFCLYRAVLREYVHLHQDQVHPERDYSVIALPPHKHALKFNVSEVKVDPKTLCEPYRCCLKISTAEFLFENEFSDHLLNDHARSYVLCCYKNCKHMEDTTKMVSHWNLFHGIWPYQCGHCKMSCGELDQMYYHFAKFHQGMMPDILVRKFGNPVPLGYTGEAFRLMRHIKELPPSGVSKAATSQIAKSAGIEKISPITAPSSPKKAVFKTVPVLRAAQPPKQIIISNPNFKYIVTSTTGANTNSNILLLPTSNSVNVTNVVLPPSKAKPVTSVASSNKVVVKTSSATDQVVSHESVITPPEKVVDQLVQITQEKPKSCIDSSAVVTTISGKPSAVNKFMLKASGLANFIPLNSNSKVMTTTSSLIPPPAVANISKLPSSTPVEKAPVTPKLPVINTPLEKVPLSKEATALNATSKKKSEPSSLLSKITPVSLANIMNKELGSPAKTNEPFKRSSVSQVQEIFKSLAQDDDNINKESRSPFDPIEHIELAEGPNISESPSVSDTEVDPLADENPLDDIQNPLDIDNPLEVENPLEIEPRENPLEIEPSGNPLDSEPSMNLLCMEQSLDPLDTEAGVNPIETEPSVNPIETEPSVNPIETDPPVNSIETDPLVNPIETEASVNPLLETEASISAQETEPTVPSDVSSVPDKVRRSDSMVSINSDEESDTASAATEKTDKRPGLLGYQLFRCASCVLSFSNLNDFKLHILQSVLCKRDGTKPYKCAHCDRMMKTPQRLVDHVQCHGMLRFSCSLCVDNFPSILQVKGHMKFRHNIAQTTLVPLKSDKNNLDLDEFVMRPVLSQQTPPVKDQAQESPKAPSVGDMTFSPEEIDKIPARQIFGQNVKCGLCNYQTKVRINIVRHLQMHAEEKSVPDTCPVNPVPCLEKNEKMFDKMTNLAASSFTSSRMGGGNKQENSEKEDEKIPDFIPSHCRFVCCAQGCNYLCPEEGNLRHHLIALHSDEKEFICAHCKRTLTPTDADNLIKHFKLHGLHLYKCNYCSFVHNLKHKVERHVSDFHLDFPVKYKTVRYMEAEPGYGSSNNDQTPSSNMQNNNVAKLKPWRCCMCKYKCATSDEIRTHIMSKHDMDTQFKCTLCTYKSDVKDTFDDHFKALHPSHSIDFIDVYTKIEEEQTKDDKEAEPFDTTPLWQRDRPRVRHIRGILFEDDVPQAKTPKKTAKKPEVSSNNRVSPVASSSKSSPSLVALSSPSTKNLFDCIEAVATGAAETLKDPLSDTDPLSTVPDEVIQEINRYMPSSEEVEEVKNNSAVIIIDDDEEEEDRNDTNVASVANVEDDVPREKNKDNKDNPQAKNRGFKRKSTEDQVENVAKISKNDEELTNDDEPKNDDDDDSSDVLIIDDSEQIEDDGIDPDELSEASLKATYGGVGTPHNRQWKCPCCNSFKSKRINDFTFHVFKDKSQFRFRCAICNDESITYKYMLDHVRLHNKSTESIIQLPQNLKLETWVQIVVREQSLAILQQVSHLNPANAIQVENMVPCAYCNKRFKSVPEYCEHMHTHWSQKPHGCSYCDFTGYSLQEVKKHHSITHPTLSFSTKKMGPTIAETIAKSDEQYKDGTKRFITAENVGLSKKRKVETALSNSKAVAARSPIPDKRSAPEKAKQQACIKPKTEAADQDLVIVTKTDTEVPDENEVFACDICPVVASTIHLIQSHLSSHHGVVSLPRYRVLNKQNDKDKKHQVACNVCHTIDSEIQIRQHFLENHPDHRYFTPYKYMCSYCQAKYLLMRNLKMHNTRKHAGMPLTYAIIGEEKGFEASVKTSKKLASMTLKRYDCTLCPYHNVSGNTAALRQHVRYHFKSVICGLCGADHKFLKDAQIHFKNNHPDEPENIVTDEQKVVDFNNAISQIIANAAFQAPDQIPAKAKHNLENCRKFARKSTSAPFKTVPLEEYSFYGQTPEFEDLRKITTTVEVNQMEMTMTADQLGKIFNLTPDVIVTDCDIVDFQDVFDGVPNLSDATDGVPNLADVTDVFDS